MYILLFIFFFFQAEDGIRNYKVTGVQTCALPIYLRIQEVELALEHFVLGDLPDLESTLADLEERIGGREVLLRVEIGRASCRERGSVVFVGTYFRYNMK